MEYKCPSCGAAISFDVSTQKMKCPFCGSEFDTASLQQYDEILQQQPGDNVQWNSSDAEYIGSAEDGMKVYSCSSCGGEVVSDETMAASSCPYCGSPIVVAEQLSGLLKPNLVIPFKVSKEEAINALKEHYKGKILLPKAFKDENHISEIKGIYVPFWLFDCDTDANIDYRCTRVYHESDSEYDITRTEYYSAVRAGSVAFDNVPVDGSFKMPDDLMESIEPFDMSEAVDFQTAFLSGFFADKYDVGAEESIPRATERIRTSTAEVFRNTVVGYDSVTAQTTNIQLTDSKVRYALLPVWLLNTTWNNEKYLFAMNGQTGKFVGNLPADKKKTFGLLGLYTGVIGAIAFAIIHWLFG